MILCTNIVKFKKMNGKIKKVMMLKKSMMLKRIMIMND